ncbi:MAG: T9SS type A sorting domain-containing protein [Bacteroidetes bacterium]|nr:T9SS type A sorting domain-containing protein [Bacteroidota bacterium]
MPYVSTADFDPDSVGTYYLTTTNSLDDEEIFVCKLHGPVFVSQLPHADFSASDTAFCTTGCIDFSNQSSASISWHWEFPGADRLTDTNQTPQNVCYSVSGIYDVILIARNSFGADTLRKVNYISVYSPDSASILVPHLDTLMRSGDSIQLCSSGNFLSYIWNTGDTSTCIQAKTAGAYWLTTTDANGCSASSDRQEVSVYPVPTVSVSVNRDTLSSFSAVSYQWYFNGNLLSGANAQTYIAKATGYYAVAIVDSNGCRATSSEVPFAITAINELDESVNIYPNPSSINNVQLSITNNLVGSSMEVYDVNGRIVFVSKLMAQSSQFDLPLSKGVYFIRILSERASVVKRFVRL